MASLTSKEWEEKKEEEDKEEGEEEEWNMERGVDVSRGSWRRSFSRLYSV